MRSFRHPRWQHLDYRVKVATTQGNKPPTQGTRQWTFTTPLWRCGSILLPSLNAGVPEPTGGEIWWITSKNNRALLYNVKLCASFQIHWWIKTGFTVQKRSIRVQIGDISSRVTFLEIWWVTFENNRAPLLYYTKLCASFQSHHWSYSPETLKSGQN